MAQNGYLTRSRCNPIGAGAAHGVMKRQRPTAGAAHGTSDITLKQHRHNAQAISNQQRLATNDNIIKEHLIEERKATNINAAALQTKPEIEIQTRIGTTTTTIQQTMHSGLLFCVHADACSVCAMSFVVM